MPEANPYARIRRELAGTPFADVTYVAQTGSTNADAAERLGDARAAGSTVVAEFQSEGAGRKGRAWIAQPGTSLLFTTILPRALPADRTWAVPFWAGLALHAALRANGVPADLQWPNDVLLGTRKLGGILCRSRVVGASAHVACGIGVNVHRTPQAGEGIEPPPAFCDDAVRVDRADLLRDVLRRYADTIAMLDDPPAVARAWERAAQLPGRRYRILNDGDVEPFDAVGVALDRDGGLIVETACARRTISMADARALR